MTSEATDGPIRAFFERHQNFGCGDVRFFTQPSLPLLDMAGNPIFKDDGSALTGPDGNGGVFRALVKSGILQQWEQQGVEACSIILVDNPLFDPFCPAMFTPLFAGADCTAAAVERTDPQEHVGLFVQQNDQTTVIEYTEIDPTLASQKDPSGRLVFRWANMSCFGCTLGFVKDAAALLLPLHVAKKNVNGRPVWKSEYFIFDALSAAQKIEIIPLERQESFAPIKDAASLERSRLDMEAKDRRRYEQLAHREWDPVKPIELPAEAYYPTTTRPLGK
jgi:UDP-N-acetylglucosamine/UDP-N-acetylgalactosamine diphosphorylase